MQEKKKFDQHGRFSFYRKCDAFNMAGHTQSPRRTHFTTTTTTTVTTTTLVPALVFAITLACLPVPAASSGVPQGCRLHPEEKMVSCRGVTSALLRDFLTQVSASKTATTTTTTTTTPPPPPSSDNKTTTINSSSTPTSTSSPDITISITTTSPLTSDDNTTSDATITTSPPPPDITTTSPQLQISNTDITFAATESEGVRGNTKNNTGAHRQDSPEVTEISCVGCRIPHLTPSLLGPPLTLERVSIVDSGVREIAPGGLSSHALTLIHLDLSHNLLQAVPDDLVKLTRLQVLDLRDNEIYEVPERTVLTPLHDLRHLYLDQNQLGQTLTSSRGQGSHLSVFDLWTTGDTPSLARLSHLGLSLNDIKEVPRGAFSRLASLIFLDLSDNLLTSLQPSDIPSSILELDFRGNPWNCTCETKWILERYAPLPPTSSSLLPSAPPLSFPSVFSTTTTTSTTTTADAAIVTVPLATIIFPTCSSPLHLHGRRLDTLTDSEVCPSEEDAGEDEVVYIGDDAQGTLREAFRALRLLNVTSLTTHALLVSWKVDAAFYALNALPLEPLSWGVTVRREREGPREARLTQLRLDKYQKEQPHWSHGNGVFAEVLDGLDPGTGYVVCLTVVQRHRLYTSPGHCLHGVTLRTPPFADAPPNATTPEALRSYSTRDYSIRTEAFTVWTESRSAALSWNVTVIPTKGHSSALIFRENLLRPLGWRVTFRRFGEKAEEKQEEVILVSRGGEPLQNFTDHYSIEGLQPGKGYVFCLHTLTDEEVSAFMSEDVNMDEFPPQSVSALSWRTPSHTQASSDSGWSVVDPRDGAGHQHLNDALPQPSPQPPVTVGRASPSPDSSTLSPPRGSDSISNAPASDSDSAFVPNLPPRAPPTSTSSNFPPIPPSLPPGPANHPLRPPQPQSGGGFVYTSTGLRIPMPSASSGLLPPFSVPPLAPPHETGPARGPSSELAATRSPSRQRYIYEFEETTPAPTPPPPSSSERQIYTYQTRRRRSVEVRRPQPSEAASLCREVITPAELDVVLPAAIAGTVSCAATVVVVLLVCCCCWPRRCCRRKGSWRSRSATDSRKVNTISAPTPVTVFSGHTAVMAGAGAGRGNGDPATTTREASDGPEKAGHSISATSSSGYLTPLHSPDGRGPQNQNPDPKAAYRSLMQSRLLQRHKDLPEFHPGYDIPPMASNKSLVGYDYPHPTPVNPIGGDGERPKPVATSITPLLPSPSSSDSNYNVSIENSPNTARSPTEVNLNIPCQQPKSSGLTKSVHVAADATNTSDYNYINPAEAPATTAARTYLKHPPSRTRHHRFGQQQRGAEEHNGILQPLSRSTPDLVTATANAEEEPASAPNNLPLRNGSSHITLPGPASLPSAASSEEFKDYTNFPSVLENSESRKQQGSPVSSSGSASKERETYHTWGGHTVKPRTSVSEVVLTGGTLIEVPEGYVVPQTPKPTPFIRLLVRGQDEPKGQSINTPTLPASRQAEGPDVARRPSHGSSMTHLHTQEVDHNTLVINTATAS